MIKFFTYSFQSIFIYIFLILGRILGLKIRKVIIPVSAGRNIEVLVEAAVRNTVLQLRGIDTMREFMEKQRKEIKKSKAWDE